MKKCVHILDTNASIGEKLRRALSPYEIDVHAYSDGTAFLDDYPGERELSNCIIIDANSSSFSGLAMLRRLRASNETNPIVIVTSTNHRNLRRVALRSGATEVIEKPFLDRFLDVQLAGDTQSEETDFTAASQPVSPVNEDEITYRVIRPDDADLETSFVRNLSDSSRHFRFFSGAKTLPPQLLYDFTHPKYPESFAIIVVTNNGKREVQVGVGRYSRTKVPGVAEYAVVVADDWQGKGIASHLLHAVTFAATIGGICTLEGVILRTNTKMLALARSLQYRFDETYDDVTVVRVVKELRGGIRNEDA